MENRAMAVNDARKRWMGLGLVLAGWVAFSGVSSVGAKALSSRTSGTALHAPLFKHAAKSAASALSDPDTLEVYCLYVEFQAETAADDVASTTGLGTFGSAYSKSDPHTYTLDPNGTPRRYRDYLDKHFEFARNYFDKVSNGRVTVRSRIFPEPGGDGKIRPYSVPFTMKAYNPSELDKDGKQKIRDFAEERGQKLMSFIYDAVKVADSSQDTTRNPFIVARQQARVDSINNNTKKHRCYLIFHAGHSRLLDGGQLGAFGANTPNDFTDFFVTQEDFHALDSATITGKKGAKADPAKRAAARGVKLSTGDTLSEVMLLSESASQEKTNWGINGILINQLARQMGMPDMFDVVKGISQLGNFDLMDFAGYNTLNGFLPVYPSAWVRAYMGWEEPVVARPPANGTFSEYPIWSPTKKPDPTRTTTVKVPINDREYLLIENRQRTGGDSMVTIYFSKLSSANGKDFNNPDSIKVKYSQIDSLFLDSVCDTKGKNCVRNTLKPGGDTGSIITGASSYDLGLPASGILVWHVNEWFISQFLKDGAVNAYLGDTLRSQYKGVELVEADGSLSIGKEFKDQLGQPAFDYGSGSDMLPHFSRKRKNPPKDTTWGERETLDMIGPYGAANTNAWNDARTHIRLEVPVPENANLEKGMSSVGDSVFNIRDSVLNLRVYWPDNKAVRQVAGSAWPIKLDTATSAQSLNILKNPNGGSLVVALSDRGYAQAFTGSGKPAIPARDTLRPSMGYDSVKTLLPSGKTKDAAPIAIHSLSQALGKPLGSATLGDSVLAVLSGDKLYLMTLNKDSLKAESKDSSAVTLTLTLSGKVGPVAVRDRFWVINREHQALAFGPDGKLLETISLPDFDYQALAVYDDVSNGAANASMNLAAVAAGGKVVVVNGSTGKVETLAGSFGDQSLEPDEIFTVTASDFDRDGAADLFLLGSKGATTLVGLKNLPKAGIFPGFPQRFQRSVRFIDTVYNDKSGSERKIVKVNDFRSEDRSGPALADLNRDGHPDILFGGTNAVFAIDYHGAFIKGWPFLLEARQNVGFTYGSRRHPETAIQSTPLVLALNGHTTVLIGSPDGLIQAVDSVGKKLSASSFNPDQKSRMGLLAVDASDWPLTMGGLTLDSNDNPQIHLTAMDLDGNGELELMAQSGTGSLNVWTLTKGSALAGASWSMPNGNAGRQNFLDVSAWSEVAAPIITESIEEFYLFPSPLRGPVATVHLRLGAEAKKARVRVYDLAGKVVKDHSWEGLPQGLQAYTQTLDLSRLGPDVYTALVEVNFAGSKKKKFVRLGVIR